MLSYTLKAGGDAQLHTEGRRRCSATHWRPEEMVSYTLKAGGDAQLHTEGQRRWSATHWRPEEMVSCTLKAGGDGQLHTEGRRRWSAAHWRPEEMLSFTRHHTVSLTECNLLWHKPRISVFSVILKYYTYMPNLGTFIKWVLISGPWGPLYCRVELQP